VALARLVGGASALLAAGLAQVAAARRTDAPSAAAGSAA
jgi:hypothetical protein